MKKKVFSMLFSILLLVIMVIPPTLVDASNNLTFEINPLLDSESISFAGDTMCIWDFTKDYTNDKVLGQPQNWMQTKYPWLNYAILMTFTGGKSYNNWYTEDGNGNPVYNFTVPKQVISNVLYSGLKPIIVIGQMPNQLSTMPSDYGDWLNWGNRYPPKDWTKYYNYIKAFAHELVVTWGTDEIKSWKFRLMTEPDNQSWWMGTQDEYNKLYDYTVAALQSEIGASNLFVGPGNLMNFSLWTNYLQHSATGTNYYTGTTGTQVNFLSVSDYEYGSSLSTLDTRIGQLWNMANAYPQLGIKEINVGEGGQMTDGVTTDNFLSMAQIGDETGGSPHAAMFRKALDTNLRYFANWAYMSGTYSQSQSTASLLKLPAYNVAQCINYMIGSKRIPLTVSGTGTSGNEVNGVASINTTDNKIYILMYNNNPARVSYTDYVNLNLRHIEPVTGSTVTVTHYRIDQTHSNFYTAWSTDSASYPRRTDSPFGYKSSLDSDPTVNLYADGIAFWNSKNSTYAGIDDLQTYESDYTYTIGANKTFSKSVEMPEHSVSLIVISNVKKEASATIIKKDELADYSQMSTHSLGLAFDTTNATALQDSSRLMRTNTATQYVTYNASNLSCFNITGLFATDSEAISDFKFYKSTDGSTWSQITGFNYQDIPVNGTHWTKRIYSMDNISNANYLKVEFPTGGINSWNPQLSRVYLSNGTVTAPTNLVTNPGFEADGTATQNPTGWTSVGNVDADFTEAGGHSGSYGLTHWKSANYSVSTSQTITGLSNGLYTLKAWVKCDYGGLGTAYMEAKDYGGYSNINIPQSSAWTQIVIPNVNVTNGQCTIGFFSNSPANSWYKVDDVEFYQQ